MCGDLHPYVVNNTEEARSFSQDRTSSALLLPVRILLRLYSPLLGFVRFSSFLILYTVGRTPWTGISL
jgi:hypothetical protein